MSGARHTLIAVAVQSRARGILMVVSGLINLFQSEFGRFYLSWGYPYGGVVTLIGGIIAAIGAKSASSLVWAIVLIIVGLIGGSLGGLLVLLGRILELITVLAKKSVTARNSRLYPKQRKSFISGTFSLSSRGM